MKKALIILFIVSLVFLFVDTGKFNKAETEQLTVVDQPMLETTAVLIIQEQEPVYIYQAGIFDMLSDGVLWAVVAAILTFVLTKLVGARRIVDLGGNINDKTLLALENLTTTLQKLQFEKAALIADELDDIPREMRDVFAVIKTKILDGKVTVSELKELVEEGADVWTEITDVGRAVIKKKKKVN